MRKDFDAEAWVNERFDWQDYNPDWLQQIVAEGGGIAIRPDEQRFSRRDDESHPPTRRHSGHGEGQ
jgi:NADH-quinone oxidoreductase subunit C